MEKKPNSLVESFITEQLSVDKMFTEYVASTLISILTKKIVPLAIGLAKLYEEEAELYFALDSPENKHRVCHESPGYRRNCDSFNQIQNNFLFRNF